MSCTTRAAQQNERGSTPSASQVQMAILRVAELANASHRLGSQQGADERRFQGHQTAVRPGNAAGTEPRATRATALLCGKMVLATAHTCSCRCGGLSVTMTCCSGLLRGLSVASRLRGDLGLDAAAFAVGDGGHCAGWTMAPSAAAVAKNARFGTCCRASLGLQIRCTGCAARRPAPSGLRHNRRCLVCAIDRCGEGAGLRLCAVCWIESEVDTYRQGWILKGEY